MNGFKDFTKMTNWVCFSKIGHSIVYKNTLVPTFTITKNQYLFNWRIFWFRRLISIPINYKIDI